MDRHPGPRVAFFGGSFDPPHLGHLAIARAAQQALQLDTVLFAPVGAQPLKPSGSSASFTHRVEMTRLAIAGEPAFAVSLADAPHPAGQPNYTLETLRRLHAELPSAGQLFSLMGADSFALLHKWWHAPEVPFAASLIVASRPGQPLQEIERLVPASLSVERAADCASALPHIPVHCYTVRSPADQTASLYILPGLDIPISATDIRTQLRTTGSSPHLLPSVAAYIGQHGLYR